MVTDIKEVFDMIVRNKNFDEFYNRRNNKKENFVILDEFVKSIDGNSLKIILQRGYKSKTA